MFKRTIPSLAALLVLLIAAGCQPYEEGPLVSFRGKEARVIGSKKVSLYMVNGIDSTHLFDSLYAGTEYATSGFSFENDFDDENLKLNGQYPGGWVFWNEDKTQIFLYFPNGSTGEFKRKGVWDIKRLSNNDLWLEFAGNHGIELRFSSVH